MLNKVIDRILQSLTENKCSFCKRNIHPLKISFKVQY